MESLENQNPENQEKKESLPEEIETKIINIDKDDFFQRVQELGAVLVKERRMLKDNSFKLGKEEVELGETSINLEGIEDIDTLKKMIEFLGARVGEFNDNFLQVIIDKPIIKRFARIRNDGGELQFNIKAKRDKSADIDERPELETVIAHPQEILNFLNRIGYKLKFYREKYRTSYQIGGDTLIELNEAPIGMPWVEVEAPSQEKIIEACKSLDYPQEKVLSMSDKDYFRKQFPDITKEKLANMRF